MPPLHVLLIEDSDDDAHLALAELTLGGFTPDYRIVEGRPELAQALTESWDLIISDYVLPRLNGLEAIAIVRERDKDVPFIMVSGKAGEDVAVAAMKAGADDYLLKSQMTRLVPTVQRELREAANRRERHRAEEALRKSEESLAELNRNLEKEVAARTEELRKKEGELYQARKLEAVGRLAGGVAHDFNNLLTGIFGVGEEIKESFPAEDPRRSEMDEILSAARRAFAVTRQLLAFSRQQVIAPQSLDVNAVVNGLHTLLRRLIGEDIRIDLDVRPSPAVYIDPGQLDQIIVNLAVNARDAMPSGGVLTLRTSAVELTDNMQGRQFNAAPGAYVLLEVADTGHGMDEATLSRIFEPFFTTKGEDRGTGLGLATVYGIVKQNAGDIAVTSHRGTGTTFKIYLPKTDIALTPRENAAPAVQPVRAGAKILVVEDESIVRNVLRKKLTRLGYSVQEARTGIEALTALDASSFDLVITDVIMPEMNGRELAAKIHARRPHTPILFISGYPSDIIAKRGILDPGINFLEKTFIAEQLEAKVRDALSQPTAP